MSELKPCPFCGDTRIKQYGGGLSQESKITVCSGCFTQVTGHELWNERPIENKIKANAIRDAMKDCEYRVTGVGHVISHVELSKYADRIERGE